MSKKYSDDEMRMLYDRNIDMLYKITYAYFNGDKGKCEDAIQDVFIKVIEKGIVFESYEHEKAWLIVAIKNKCKNMLKSKWNNESELEIDIPEEHKEDTILEKVLKLPNVYKLPIYLYYYEGYSCIEISKILNKKENTIYSCLNRGRNILKLEIEEELK